MIRVAIYRAFIHYRHSFGMLSFLRFDCTFWGKMLLDFTTALVYVVGEMLTRRKNGDRFIFITCEEIGTL